ncbi:MAG TPA: hypothetical protein VKP11_06220 [Frankiaceae bacterium]|nr:hypothetical protein [Frankiaceae bacterium]
MTGRRALLLTASMGAGHDACAQELARRLADRADDAVVVDLLELLPARAGIALRASYAVMLTRAPWLYDVIYRRFLAAPPPERLSSDPLVRLALPRVASLVARLRPDAVVPLFHVAAQVTGALRAQRRLTVPVTVVITEVVAHGLWVHPGNDRHVCLHDAVVGEVAAHGGRDPVEAAPLLRAEFRREPTSRASLPVAPNRLPVLVTGGGWGAGDVTATARLLRASRSFAPVVLCGRNDRLRRRLQREPGVIAVGWQNDVRPLVDASAAVVQNAAGLTFWEALAARRPVVTYRPLPGHATAAAARLDALGLAAWARDGRLVATLEQVTDSGAHPALPAATDPADLVLFADVAGPPPGPNRSGHERTASIPRAAADDGPVAGGA